MDIAAIAVVCTGLLAYAMFSGKLAGTLITAPLVFIIFGFLIGDDGFAIANVDPGHSAIHLLAEITLLIVLFTDAARIDLKLLRRDHQLPQRMLIIGLPLVIVAGMLLALLVLPALSFWEAALLAALLAPTDAALGQAVVSAREVPVRIRQAINVESGLNDGIALPAVLLFAALAAAGTAIGVDSGHWVRFAVLLILENSDIPNKDQILTVTVLTVALSALLHGISAAPLARIYARHASAMGECEENKPVTEMPLRHGAGTHLANKQSTQSATQEIQ